MLRSILAQIGISTAATVAIVWTAIQFLGKSLIENRFKQQFEKLQFKHSEQIESLKLSLEVLRNRISKLSDQEFIVLPDIWSKMAAALGTIIGASDLQRDYPSTIGMNEGELNEYLESAPLLAWEKGAIRAFSDELQKERDTALRNMLDWADYRRARRLADDFGLFLQSRRIFMSEDLALDLDRCFEMLDGATIEFRKFLEERQSGNLFELKVCPKLKAESKRISDAIRNEIQKKLFANG